jgi:microcystin-dependent protein
MQSFGLLSDDTLVAEAPEVINDSLKSIASDFAGAAFPTTNLFAFMTCYRTDEQKLYRLQGDLTTWLPEIPDSVPHATNADHATIADNATNATNADHATTADNATNATNAATAAGLTDAVISALMLKMYPVGSIYASTASTNPGTLFGGTWEALPAGRVLLAQGTSTWGTTYAAGSTGGEATHTLTIGELPSHSHGAINQDSSAYTDYCFAVYRHLALDTTRSQQVATSTSSNIYTICAQYTASDSGGNADIGYNATTANTGSGTAHNNIQPYIAVFLWKRVS